MNRPPNAIVEVDLARIRDNAEAVRRRVGVPVLAVVKADAYGLGAQRVARALADVVEGFCVFSLEEAAAIDLWALAAKPILALGPPDDVDPAEYRRRHVRPAVTTVEQAAGLRLADPILCVDTGMQRFACPAEQLDAVVTAGHCREAFNHATRLDHVRELCRLTAGHTLMRHAAATSLLDEPAARLDAVRPGLALYRGALRVATRLTDARESRGPVGYTGFAAARHGVIPVGYSHGLRPGPCLVNGERRTIREVGMQSAYVEIVPADRAGDEVTLLGAGLAESEVAAAWRATPQEVLLRLSGAAPRIYVGE